LKFYSGNGDAGLLTTQQNYRIFHDGYVSEFTEFMGHFLADHPEVVKNQKAGWHIFWDRVVDLDELKKAEQESATASLSYYFPNSTQGLLQTESHH
jgi:hypothetical protein